MALNQLLCGRYDLQLRKSRLLHARIKIRIYYLLSLIKKKGAKGGRGYILAEMNLKEVLKVNNQKSFTSTQTSNMAVISLAFGILTWILLPLIGAIVAIVTGHIAKRDIRESDGFLTGNGMATVGLVLGYGQIVFIVIPICVIVIITILGPSIGDVFSNIINEISAP